MKRLLLALLTSTACKSAPDLNAFIEREASYLRPGVDFPQEEQEVRRVLAQRGLRVTSRVQQVDARWQAQGFVALGAQSSDRKHSAVRVITGRGVVLADDAQAGDLFHPSTLSLIDHFGGKVSDFVLLAYARIPLGQKVGCVSLQRILPDANIAPCDVDVSQLGARACVSDVVRAGEGMMRGKVAWPSLHGLRTPQIDVELSFDDIFDGRAGRLLDEEPAPIPRAPTARLAPGPWIDSERAQLANVSLNKADFADRHAVGVARAALAKLAGKDLSEQIESYRVAIGTILPASPEAALVGETLRHIQSGWLDTPDAPPAESRPREREPAPNQAAPTPIEPEEPLPEDSIVIEPPAPEGEAR